MVAGDGTNVVLGDSGSFTYSAPGVLSNVTGTDTDPLNVTGGADTITAGDGSNTVMGGALNDTITAGMGRS